MADFSKILGISTSALRNMENGRPGVSIGQWAEVLRRLKRLADLDLLLTGTDLHSSPMHRGRQRGLGFRSLRPTP
jgi:hypothetical protein